MERFVRFMAEVPPFSFLSDDERRGVAQHMLVEYFPTGSVTLQSNLDRAEFLCIVRKGQVRITPDQSGEPERLISLCGEGDSFGASSLLEHEAFIFNATSDDDTICYFLPKAEFQRLYNTPQTVANHFSPSLSVSLAHAYPLERKRLLIQRHTNDYSPLFQSVVSLIKRSPVVGTPDLTMRKATETMTLERVGSLAIFDDNGRPEGIITDTDFRTKIVACHQSVNIPISTVLSIIFVWLNVRVSLSDSLVSFLNTI